MVHDSLQCMGLASRFHALSFVFTCLNSSENPVFTKVRVQSLDPDKARQLFANLTLSCYITSASRLVC